MDDPKIERLRRGREDALRRGDVNLATEVSHHLATLGYADPPARTFSDEGTAVAPKAVVKRGPYRPRTPQPSISTKE